MKTFCPECGFSVEIDEDGCCIDCGATAVGDAVDMLHKKGEITHRLEENGTFSKREGRREE